MVATHTSDGREIKVTDTDTTNRNYPHNLLINQLIPEITPVVILTVNQTTVDWVAERGGTLYVVHTVLSTEIATDAADSAACVFKDPLVVNWKDTHRTIERYRNTVKMDPIATTPFSIGLVIKLVKLQRI